MGSSHSCNMATWHAVNLQRISCTSCILFCKHVLAHSDQSCLWNHQIDIKIDCTLTVISALSSGPSAFAGVLAMLCSSGALAWLSQETPPRQQLIKKKQLQLISQQLQKLSRTLRKLRASMSTWRKERAGHMARPKLWPLPQRTRPKPLRHWIIQTCLIRMRRTSQQLSQKLRPLRRTHLSTCQLTGR